MSRSVAPAASCVVASLALLAGACTSSSGAATQAASAVTTREPTESTSETTEFAPDLIDLGTIVTYPDEVQIVFANEIVTSDGTMIVTVDPASRESHVLLSVAPLAIGDDPALSERFGRLDIGLDRMVVFEVSQGVGPPHINVLSATGDRTDAGPGSHPAIRQDGEAFAFSGPSGITVMWSAESVLGSGVDVPGAVTAIRFSPTGWNLAVSWENEGRGGVTIFDLEPNGFVGSSELTPPSGHRYGLASWIDVETIVVHDTTGADDAGSLLTIDVATGDVLDTVLLEDMIVDFDYAAGGSALLVVTVDGEVKWIGGGATGSLFDLYSVGARW